MTNFTNGIKKVQIKSAKGRKLSSKLWLERQLNDPYVQEAKKKGYRSRAAFKLIELNEKFSFLKKGQIIVDLGAAPGGWSQVAADIIQPSDKKGQVVAMDLKEIDPIPDVDFFQGDFTDDNILEILEQKLKGKPNVILSDMAASATGMPDIDHDRIMMLCELVFDFAFKFLAHDGTVVVKVLKGGTENNLLQKVKQYFSVVKHVKPKASRQDSAESYLIATGFKN